MKSYFLRLMDLNREYAYTLTQKLVAQEITAEDLMSACLRRIEALEDKLHAFTIVYKEEALKNAREIDKKRKLGKKLGRLAGIPIGIKELVSVKGHQCTCGSRMLKNYIAPYDAHVIEKLVREAQAIEIGRMNMDEFAMGSSTESSYFGITRNPWDLKRVPGGSSGGCGAAMASDESIISLGSDTGGSIRCPAAYCGVTGIKPTYGRNSRYGIVAYSNSLEQVGPVTKCVKDSALMLEIMAGYDPRDSTSANIPVDPYTQMLEGGIDGLTIGVPDEFFGEGINPEVKSAVKNTLKEAEKLGAHLKQVSLPNIKYALPTYYVIAMSEASSNLARYDGLRYGYRTSNTEKVKTLYNQFKQQNIPISESAAEIMVSRMEGFGPEVRRRIILGTFTLSAGYADQYYLRALKVRTLIRQDFLKALESCNVLIGPTMPNTAFLIGTKTEDPLQMYMEDILTVPINLAAVPSMSINCGFDKSRLPIGLQIMGRYFDEKTVFRMAYTLEQKLDLYRQHPAI
jgi:aspartyl-tRNA(Asn)/glutamyl-tRNA(Gln) amidotransferase subunit A